MGYELYCGDKPGTVNIWNTIVSYMEVRNLTPAQVEKYMYNNIKESAEHSAKYRNASYGEHISGLFHDDYRAQPVINTEEHIHRYASKYSKKWKKGAQDKVDDCRARGIEHGEAVHLIEFRIENDQLKKLGDRLER